MEVDFLFQKTMEFARIEDKSDFSIEIARCSKSSSSKTTDLNSSMKVSIDGDILLDVS